jgi:hypothetical protein
VLAALEAYELSTIKFEEADEPFQPNPCGIAGFFKQRATIPVGVCGLGAELRHLLAPCVR